jgi:hypothetical protein
MALNLDAALADTVAVLDAFIRLFTMAMIRFRSNPPDCLVRRLVLRLRRLRVLI